MPAIETLSALWNTVKDDLKTLFSEEVFDLYFAPMHFLESKDDTLTLSFDGTDFSLLFATDNYLALIRERLHLNSGRDIKVKLHKNPAANNDTPLIRTPAERSSARRIPAKKQQPAPAQNSGLLPNNTFETYIIGPNNELAHAAALAVAQAPGQAYNPLFIYGDTGLGKTHLMHAIGHAVLGTKPHARVLYLSAEKFTNDYVQAIQENTLTKFRQHYRSIDVLLLDDVQFLGGKERIQEEFFHTFNELHVAGKHIVLSSDRRASEITKLEHRLVSRFEWGLVTDIQAPDYETRLAIILKKAASFKFDLPSDVAEFIARNISKNIRALEGALLKVISVSTLRRKPIDLPTAEHLLKDALAEQARNQLTIDTIQKAVCAHYQIPLSDMLGKRRPNKIAYPRQVAMYLSRTLTKHSLQEIGESFGGRDHGTVIHAVKTVENITSQDRNARGSLDLLQKQLSR